MPDKFSAVWVSHSSISDFINCPRTYYLNNLYRNPKTNNKIAIMSPPLALGQVIHEVIESLSIIPTQERFKTSLTDRFNQLWPKISGLKGGFSSNNQENQYKESGLAMLKKVEANPGPLTKLAVKIKMDLPYFWLSETDNIILCGKIDWLEYLPDKDSVHIIDFKTSKQEENQDSLQLPIYHLLVHHCQHRKVEKASYWYLRFNDKPQSVKLPDIDSATKDVLSIAKKIKLARTLEKFSCPSNGCFYCNPYETILSGKATFVGTNDFKQDQYVLESTNEISQSEVL